MITITSLPYHPKWNVWRYPTTLTDFGDLTTCTGRHPRHHLTQWDFFSGRLTFQRIWVRGKYGSKTLTPRKCSVTLRFLVFKLQSRTWPAAMQIYLNKWECSHKKRAQVICLVCAGWIHCQWACSQFTITLVRFPPWFYTYLLLATLAQNRIYPSIFRVFTDILTRFHSRMWSGTRQSVCIKESLIPKEVGLVCSGWRCLPIHLLPIIHPLGAHCQLGFLFDFKQLL